MENIEFFDNEELYLQELFSVEKLRDEINDAVSFTVMDQSILIISGLNEDIEKSSSLESLSDKISFNKSRLLIAFKKLISELVKIVLEFFGMGATQKKVLLMLGKTFNKYFKDLNKTFSERISNKGPYDFSNKPITIRDTHKCFIVPLTVLTYLSVVVGIDISESITTKPNATPSIGKTLTPDQTQKLTDVLYRLMGTTMKVSNILGVLGNTEAFKLAKYAGDAEGNISQDADGKYMINNIESLKRVSEWNPKNFMENIAILSGAPKTNYNTANTLHTSLANLGMGVENANGSFTVGSVAQGTQHNFLDKWYTTENIEKIKTFTETSTEKVNEIIESMTNIDTVDIDSTKNFNAYCLMALDASKRICEYGKNINFEKDMDNIKKSLDKIQKDFGRFTDDLLDVASVKYSLSSFITVTTYMYNVSKGSLHRYIKAATRIIDNGLTDIKKVEAALA